MSLAVVDTKCTNCGNLNAKYTIEPGWNHGHPDHNKHYIHCSACGAHREWSVQTGHDAYDRNGGYFK
jgi:hypothetical protein